MDFQGESQEEGRGGHTQEGFRESVRWTTTRKPRKVLRRQLAISPLRSGELPSTFDIDWYGDAPWEALPEAIRNYMRALRHSSVKWTDEERAQEEGGVV